MYSEELNVPQNHVYLFKPQWWICRGYEAGTPNMV